MAVLSINIVIISIEIGKKNQVSFGCNTTIPHHAMCVVTHILLSFLPNEPYGMVWYGMVWCGMVWYDQPRTGRIRATGEG